MRDQRHGDHAVAVGWAGTSDSTAAPQLSRQEDPYLRFHAPRYDLLLAKVRELVSERPRILDVGHSYESELLRRIPGAVVDSLGFGDERFPPRERERHVSFDLRDAGRPEAWPELGEYDLVVCAEVIEHLPVSPVAALRFIASALRPGGWLVLQTPNAAHIANRLRLLAGRNPFEQLRDSSVDPGHIREYTVDELIALGREAGFEIGGWLTANYFVTGSALNSASRRLELVVPRRLRAGITAWLWKPPD